MSGVFDIDTGPESLELLEKARVELRETPEIRQEGFKQLKDLIKQNPDLNFSDTEEFMEIILRCCHWYPESAIKLVRKFTQLDHVNLYLFYHNWDRIINQCDYNRNSNCTILSNIHNIFNNLVHSSFSTVVFIIYQLRISCWFMIEFLAPHIVYVATSYVHTDKIEKLKIWFYYQQKSFLASPHSRVP